MASEINMYINSLSGPYLFILNMKKKRDDRAKCGKNYLNLSRIRNKLFDLSLSVKKINNLDVKTLPPWILNSRPLRSLIIKTYFVLNN